MDRESHTSLPGHPDHVRECRDCGLLQSLPPLEGGSVAHCSRCNSVLRRASIHSETFPLVSALLAAALFLAAMVIPFMGIHAPGHEAHATAATGPEWLRDRGFWPLSLLVFTTLILMPFLKLAGLVTTLIALRMKQRPRWLGRVYRYTRMVAPWAMIEVFILGAFIAFTRLGQLATVEIEPAMWAMVGVILASVAAQATFDEEEVWDAAGALRDRKELEARPRDKHIACEGCGRLERGVSGDKCLRCGASLHVRRPNAMQRTWALLLAGAFLYVPANILPILTVSRFGRPETNTILSGVVELVNVHLVLFAMLVFTASIIVPMFKLFGLVSILVTTHLGTHRGLRFRTKMFRVIDAIGRWSMIDVFMLSTLVALVHMGFIGTIVPEWGAVAFAGVVVITMVAAEGFDPRLMWDAAAAHEKEHSHEHAR